MSSLKFALRTLFKTPFVTIIAIVSLALGIGANAAIFSCFNQMLLESLNVPRPAELVNLAAPEPKPGSQSCGQAGDCDAVFSYAMFRDLQKVQTVFTGIAAHVSFGANMAFDGQTMAGQGLLVSGNYFQVLQVQPALGRLFDSNDDRLVGEAPVVVLGHGFWTTKFAADPNVLNKTVKINGQTLTIVGVAAAKFDGTTLGQKPQVYVPVTLRGQMSPGWRAWSDRTNYWAYLFARLRPGVSIEQARQALNGQYRAILNDVEAPLQQNMSDVTMARFRAKPIVVEPGGMGQSSVRDGSKTPLYLLLGVTGFVLLIACANIANLLLARSAARAAEMAVRLSLGAGRSRLIRQLLTESLLLAAFGGLAGLFVAHWTLALIMGLLPAQVADTMNFVVSPRAMAFAAVLTIGTGLLFGLFPALHSTRPDLVSTLKSQAGQPSGARKARAVPPGAGHHADRAVDDAARRVRVLRQEPAEREPRRSGDQDRQHDHVPPLARLERLHPRALARLLSAARGTDRRDARRHVGDRLDGADSLRQQLGQRRRRPGLRSRPGHRQQFTYQPDRSRLFLRDGRSPDRRP